MRITLATAVACLAIGAVAAADRASAAMRKPTAIAAQGLGPALTSLAKEFDFQVLYQTEIVGTLRTQGASGAMTATEALEHVLTGTGLTYKYLDDKTVTIIPTPASVPSSPGAAPPLGKDTAGDTDAKEGKNSSSGEFRLAQTSHGTTSSTPAVAQQTAKASDNATLQEVLVTAQKRSERLQDVPVPVTAIDAATLVDANQTRLQDYFARAPGLSVAAGSSSSTYEPITIRGITTGGGTNPTVGILVDDVPFGSPLNIGGGNIAPDMDPGDLARVEVLRGPQGTLYGASSMGGLIKFVTRDPTTDGISGNVQAGTSSVYNGAQPGYNFRGSVNLPLGDTLAVRASGFTREDPGYIDNPVLHIDGINKQTVSGGRFAALWRPSQDWSLKINAVYQDFRADGVNDVDLGLGDLQQSYLRGTGASRGTLQIYGATLTGNLEHGMTLTAVSGYNIRESQQSSDLTYCCSSFTQQVYGADGAAFTDRNKIERLTQEIRLSGPIGNHVEWLLGAFYTHEHSSSVQDIFAEDSASGQIVADGDHSPFRTLYEEYAAFADLTVHLTDRFDVQLGGRGSAISETLPEGSSTDPLFSNGSTAVITTPATHATAHPFTYLLTPRFRISPDLMLYARVASGFRPGGPNAGCAAASYRFPCSVGPDKTLNYELGSKGDFLDHKLSLDASLYYIDWRDIQLALVDPITFGGYNANAGKAKSQGIELSAELRPLNALTVTAWTVLSDAKLTQAIPANSNTFGVAGDRLPYSSRFSANLSIEQRFPFGSVTGFVGGSVSYVGDRLGGFGSTFDPAHQRQDLPGYARMDLRVGAQQEGWTGSVFVNNALDKRGLLDGGSVDFFPPSARIYIQPRTIGLNVARAF